MVVEGRAQDMRSVQCDYHFWGLGANHVVGIVSVLSTIGQLTKALWFTWQASRLINTQV